jgi:eukaryotic-like serine/threonine-protein kinase
VLGDSVRRRTAKAPKAKKTAARTGRRWNARHWLALLGALTLPFIVGYVVAVRVIFPPPAVVAEGIPVPNLIGESSEAAQRDVTSAGLGALNLMRLPSPTEAEGVVIAQSPLAGQQLRSGARVRVAVSSGKPRVFVPDVIGFPVERAASLLTRLGFQVKRIDTESDEPRGQVLAIDPESGTRLELPSGVTITVSSGPPELPPPDTGGVTQPPATAGRIGWSATSTSPIFPEGKAFTRLERAWSNGRE